MLNYTDVVLSQLLAVKVLHYFTMFFYCIVYVASNGSCELWTGKDVKESGHNVA
jgi:hypothetical protein